VGQVLEGHQGGRVVLAQSAAQGVGVSRACPDQVLVGAGENFDRFRIGAVAGDRAVVVPVGAYQIGQQLGIAGIGFGARDVVTVAVVGHRQRVDRIHLIAGGRQRPHPQTAVDLNPDHRLFRFLSVRRDQLVQLADAGQSLGQPPRGQPPPGLVHQIHIVMLFGPVIADRDHRSPPSIGPHSTYFEPEDTRRRPNGSVLEAARHPSSATGDPTNRPGHDLHLGIDPHSRFSKCSPAGGSVTSLPRQAPKPRQRADRFPLGSSDGPIE